MALALFSGALLLNACNDNVDENTSPAHLSVRLTDTTANYDSVMIDVQSVEIKGAGGTVLLNANPGMYNLLEFTNGKDTLIASGDIAAGHVSQIRLILGSNNYVVIGGVRYNLSTPSAQQSGLKLNVQTDFSPGVDYMLLLDFDAGRSIVTTGNGSYSLKPVIRVVSVAATGSIAGLASPNAALPALATAMSSTDTLSAFSDSTGHFLIRGVPAGTYTVVIEPQLPYIPDTIHAVSVSVGSMTDVGTVNF